MNARKKNRECFSKDIAAAAAASQKCPPWPCKSFSGIDQVNLISGLISDANRVKYIIPPPDYKRSWSTNCQQRPCMDLQELVAGHQEIPMPTWSTIMWQEQQKSRCAQIQIQREGQTSEIQKLKKLKKKKKKKEMEQSERPRDNET